MTTTSIKEEDIKNVVESNNQFAVDLYRRLQKQDGNLFFASYNISSAFAMIYAGAQGKTAEQMAETFHFPLIDERLHSAFAKLTQELKGTKKDVSYQLSFAHALFGQKGNGFLQSFLDLTQRFYGTGLKEVDFINELEKTRLEINLWVEKETKNKIKDLISPHALDSLERLLLVSAVYFKGNWANPFEKEQTKEMPFFVTEKKKINIPMMHQTATFKYGETNDIQVLELPYNGDALSMIIFLPKKRDGIAFLEESFVHKELNHWISKLSWQEIEIILPKFKISSEFQLEKILLEMGIHDAFDPQKADFTGMYGRKKEAEPLLFSKIFHRALIEVHEEGAEAVAITAFETAEAGIASPPTIFRADHPFLFLIRDCRTGSFLFIGRVIDPSDSV